MIAKLELPKRLEGLENAAVDAWFARQARALTDELWKAARAGMAATTQVELDHHTLVLWEVVERLDELSKAQRAFFRERKRQSAVRSVSHYTVELAEAPPENRRTRRAAGTRGPRRVPGTTNPVPVHESRDEQLLADALRCRGGCLEARSGHVPRVRERG